MFVVPPATSKVKQTKLREVERGGVHVARGDEDTRRIEGRHGAAHAQWLEESMGEIVAVGIAVAHDVGDNATEHVGRAARVVEERTGFASEGQARGVTSHVLLAFTEEHLEHVTGLADLVLFHEGQPVAHRQEVTKSNLVSGIGLVAPLGHRGELVRVESPLIDEGADHHVQHRLGH